MTDEGAGPLDERSARHAPGRPWAKLVLGALALAALVLLARRVGEYVPQFAVWVQGLGPWGPAVFVLGYALAVVAFVPGSVLTLAGGAVFGLAQGVVIVFAAALLGSGAAFLVARYLARGAVESRIAGDARFERIDRAVGREGLKIVFLLRLSPVFPFNLLNYALGLTGVRFRDYMLGGLGMLPGTFLYVYYGVVLGSVAAVAGGAEVERGAGGWALLGVGLVATVVVTTIVTRIARRALAEATGEEEGG